MGAALLKSREAASEEGQLSRTRISRDLYQIAELVELAFAERLDGSGRAAVREMKLVGRLGPLLWLLALIDRVAGLSLGTGYVWRAQGRGVGNASIYRGGKHPRLGRGFLIANVAVHPDYRRRGIARALMDASLDLIRRKGGRWAALQVEADNSAALHLYDDMGLTRFATLEQWEASRLTPPLAGDPPGWVVRERRPGEAPAEMVFIYDRARPGGMAWTRTIEPADIRDLGPLGGILRVGGQDHWLLTPAHAPDRIAGVLCVQRSAFDRPRLTLFLDPALADDAARQALLRHVLSLPDLRSRPLRIEVPAGDAAVEGLLKQCGFRRGRALVQMRLQLTP